MYLLRFEHWRVCMHICVPTPSPPANLVGRQLLAADERRADLQALQAEVLLTERLLCQGCKLN